MKRMIKGVWFATAITGLFFVPFLVYGTYNRSSLENGVWVLKTNSEGDSLRAYTYEGRSTTFPSPSETAQLTSDGGCAIIGTINKPEATKPYLLRIDSLGKIIWERTYPADFRSGAYSMRKTSDGGYVLLCDFTLEVGQPEGSGGLTPIINSDLRLIKTDSLGNILWTQKYGGDFLEIGGCVAQANDGGYLVTSSTTSYPPQIWFELLILRTDSLGNLLWMRTVDTTSAVGNYIDRTSDGSFVITGEKEGNIYLLKIDADGKTQWDRSYEPGVGYVVHETQDGGCIVGAKNETSALLIKTDSKGNTLWSRPFEVYDSYVQITADGGYIVAGNKDKNVRLVKIDAVGNIVWEKAYSIMEPWRSAWVHQTQDKGFIVVGDRVYNASENTD